MTRTIKSERRDMGDLEYTRHAINEAAAWGRSVPFWLRELKEPSLTTRLHSYARREAIRRARLAGRWALKVLGRPPL